MQSLLQYLHFIQLQVGVRHRSLIVQPTPVATTSASCSTSTLSQLVLLLSGACAPRIPIMLELQNYNAHFPSLMSPSDHNNNAG